MMKDIKLDALTHDIDISNLNLSLVKGIDRVVQNVKIRLLFMFGEWFLDTRQGVKFYEVVFVKNPDLDLIDNTFKATIIDTDNVLDIVEYTSEFDARQRKFTVTFKINTTFGQTDLISQEL